MAAPTTHDRRSDVSGSRRGRSGPAVPATSTRPSPAPEPSADIDVSLAHRKIQVEPDRAGDGYLSAHTADRLDVDGLLALLRVRADLLQVRAPSLPAGQGVQRIESPEWARLFPLPKPEPIAVPAPDPRFAAMVVHPIVRPAWGRDRRLPFVSRIEAPSGQPLPVAPRRPVEVDAWAYVDVDAVDPPDPARELLHDLAPSVGGLPALPRLRMATERPVRRDVQARAVEMNRVPQHGRSEPAPVAEHASPAERASPTEHQHARPPVALRPTPPPPPPPPPPPEVPSYRPGPMIPPVPPPNPASPGAFPVHTRSGAGGCLARLLAIGVLALIAWVGVDMALEEWVGAQGRLADSLASAGVEPQTELPPLLSQGEPNAVFQVLLACDPTVLDCRKTLHWLTAWQAKEAEAPTIPALGPPRLVFLQRVGDDPDALTVGAALQALDAQDLFWSSVPALAEPSQSMQIEALRLLVDLAGGKGTRWERDRTDPDTQLHVRTDRTMAEALEVPAGVGVLASGQPLDPTVLRSAESLQAALAVSALALQRAIETHAGDVAAGQLSLLQGQKPMVQQRYLHWILRSQRMGPVPPPAP
jgi:hypothetical protein